MHAVEAPFSTAVLIVRVWFEGDPPSFRARLIDVRPPALEQTLRAPGNPEDLYAAVHDWVEKLTSD